MPRLKYIGASRQPSHCIAMISYRTYVHMLLQLQSHTRYIAILSVTSSKSPPHLLLLHLQPTTML